MPRKPSAHHPFRSLRERVTSVPPVKQAPKRDEPMASTGAVRLEERPRRVPHPLEPRIVAKPRPENPAFLLTNDRGRIEGARRDLSARQRRTLHGTPTATCDLHGQTAALARKTLRAFLTAEHARGRTLVLVIVGRGRHSPGKRPVLQKEVADWLTEPPLGALVLGFHTAPPELGGEGGLLVRLSPEAG